MLRQTIGILAAEAVVVPLVLGFEFLKIPEALNSYARISRTTHEPQMSWVHVKLA